jgi:hypothetical protein
MADIERFWCLRDGQFHLDNDGFLADPNELIFGRIRANPEAIRTPELRGLGAVVMLGEMGAGKSKVLESPDLLVAPGIDLIRVNLAEYGSEDRFVSEVIRNPTIEQWKTNSNELAVVLDGFDEAQERIPQLGQVLAGALREWPVERLVFRIASRTFDWSRLLERTLNESFEDLKVVALLPLRRQDTWAIAAELCDDPDGFLVAVDGAKASAFASRPQTLRMLATSFQRDGTLPSRAAALYERGTRSLAEEGNEGRVESGLDGSLTLDERIAVARRVATGLTFGRSAAIWTGREDEVEPEGLLIASLAEGSEPSPHGSVAVTGVAVRDVLSTGLFTSMGSGRLGFAHASFADYLTAAWIDANDLGNDKVQALVIGPDGRARPQLRAVAAWLAAIHPDQFEWLAAQDPESFLGQVDLPSDALRAAVIDGLFKDADRRDWGWGDRLDGLKHEAIVEQVRPRILAGTADQQRLAIKLARDCQLTELLPELIRVALNSEHVDGLRTRAAFAAIAFESGPLTGLAPLVLDEAVRGPDATDELLGAGLTASWPHAVSTAQVFAKLGTPKVDSFFGAYRRFIDEFGDNLRPEDVPEAISWLEAHLKEIRSGDFEDFGDLANAIIRVATATEIDSNVGKALGRVAVARAANWEGLLFGLPHRRRDSLALTSDARRRLAVAVLNHTTDDPVVLYLSDAPARGSGLLTATDLEWIVAEAATANGKRLDALDRLFGLTFSAERREHVDFFLDLAHEHPIRQSRQDWIQVELGSDKAAEMRKMHDLVHPRRRRQVVQPDQDDVRIAELLERIEGGEPKAFVALGEALATNQLEPDVTTSPRWRALEPADQERVISAAHSFLSTTLCDAEGWLDDVSFLDTTAQAGYRALTVLLRAGSSELDRLSSQDWAGWAPVIATTMCAVNGALWKDKVQLLEYADPHSHAVLVSALSRYIRAAIAADLEFLFWTNEVDFLFDDDLEAFALDIVVSTRGPIASGLLAALTRNRPEAAIPVLRSMFADSSSDRRAEAITAGTLLVDYDLADSWELLKSRFDEDRSLALAVLGEAETVTRRKSDDFLPEDLMADIYLWLRQEFDPADDPDAGGVHIVGPREEVGRWRDHLLIALRDKGTAAAIDALDVIARTLPTVTAIQRIQVDAMSNFSNKAWDAISIHDLVLLAHQERSALIATELDLLAVVVRAFDDVQRQLTGANPQSHLLWDTHSHRPKTEDEISDFIANRLEELSGRNRLVVNREVQVRRNRPSGVPERADVQVDAATGGSGPFATISLPIEVKGAWNNELLTAMRSQLVARYMTDLHVDHGCYVVLWPDVEPWKGNDSRRSVVAALDQNAVIDELDRQAQDLRQEGINVEVVHLGIEYQRPDRSLLRRLASISSRLFPPRGSVASF